MLNSMNYMYFSAFISNSTIIFGIYKKTSRVFSKNIALVVLEIVFIFTINPPHN